MKLTELHCVRRIRRYYKIILILYVVSICLYYLNRGNKLSVQVRETCTMEDGAEFVKDLCYNYTSGHITGSLCHSLCVKKEFSFLTCMSHKKGNVILLSEWRNMKVVLKADEIRTLTRNRAMSTTYYGFLESLILYSNISVSVAKHILSECDVGSDGLFTEAESIYCWHLYDREEIHFMFLLPGNTGIPNLFGVCGHLVVVEYASTIPLVQLPLMKEYRSWELRAKMAIALIEMVEAVEDTKYGPLFLCDFQRSNFGFVEINGRLVAKSIDNDISLFKKDLYAAMSIEKNNTCSSDNQCDYIKCHIPCNRDTGKCSGMLMSNNLQMLCSIFLVSEIKVFYTGILWNPPPGIKKDLTSLLNQCAYPLTPSDSISRRLATKLKELLYNSFN